MTTSPIIYDGLNSPIFPATIEPATTPAPVSAPISAPTLKIVSPQTKRIWPSPTAADHIAQKARWAAYTDYVEQWIYRPDLEALRVIFTVAASQFSSTEAIWCFLIGPSGSAKTFLGINSLLQVPNSHVIGSLTPKTFLSGYKGKDGVDNSLLHRLGPSAIMLMKDFTTFLSLREDARKELASQLREIWDGYFASDKGTGSETWQGKITVIAAVTPVVERYWGFMASMGERFISVRWPRVGGLEVIDYSRRQAGHEQEIAQEFTRLGGEFFQGARPMQSPPPDLSQAQAQQIGALAEIVTHCRCGVERTQHDQKIRDLPQIDQTGRLGKTLANLPRFHAALFRSPVIGPEDMSIASRVALDSIPWSRRKIMEVIPKDNDVLCTTELLERTGLTPSALKWNLEELIALGVIREKDQTLISDNVYELTPYLREMWGVAFPQITSS